MRFIFLGEVGEVACAIFRVFGCVIIFDFLRRCYRIRGASFLVGSILRPFHFVVVGR